MPGDGVQNVPVPDDQVALGRNGRPALVGVDQLQGVSGQLEGRLKGIVGVAHGPGSDEGGPDLPCQVVPQDAQGVCLGLHRIKVRVLIAGTAAVAVQAPVAAPPIDIHGVIRPEPPGVPAAVKQMFSRKILHLPTSFPIFTIAYPDRSVKRNRTRV